MKVIDVGRPSQAVLDGLGSPSYVNHFPADLISCPHQALVGQALLANPDLAAFDAFVAHPRFFGDMAEWLRARGILSDQDPSERKRYLQTLIRWLRHFLPGRYRLEEPNYSEVFGRVEPKTGS